MAEFADLLSPQLPAPPPPPRGGFADILAAGFGAGPDRMGAYQKGLDAGSQYKLRTAQTESALAEAEKRRAEAMRESTRNDIIAKAQAQPDYTPGIADMLAYATGAGDLARGQLGQQELGFRGILGDVNALPEQQFAAGQGVQGKVLPRMEDIGGQTYNLATDPNMQAPTMTPMQQAQLNAENALTGQRNRSPASGATGTGGWDMVTVGGRRMRERINPETGAYESEFVTDPQMLGRERMFAERVRVAGESVADTLENIAQMPVGASTGVFGVGAAPGKSMLAATKDTLRNAVTSADVQMYTAALAGANRALAVLESAGLAPSGMAQQSFESLAWREGDDKESTRLYKLAEMRQTVDNAMQTALTNPAITPDMKAQIEGIMRRVQAAVPFSPMDILLLERSPGTTTLADILKQRGLAAAAPGGNAAPAASAAPAGGEPAPQTQAEYDALPPGTIYVDTDGKRKRKR